MSPAIRPTENHCVVPQTSETGVLDPGEHTHTVKTDRDDLILFPNRSTIIHSEDR